MIEYADVNPATGETVARYDSFTDAQVEQTLRTAEAGFETWRKLPVAERAGMVRRAAELYRKRREKLAAIVVREMGKVKVGALAEVDFAADITEYYADQAEVITADQPLTIRGEGTALIRCPESAAAIEAIYRDAGLPVGAYLNVYISHEQAATIIADPRIQGVPVTGSARAGAMVVEMAGRHLKKVALELGGSDPFLVLATNDLDAVVAAATAARLDNTGQSCNGAKRFIVVDRLYEAFLTRFAAAMAAAPVC